MAKLDDKQLMAFADGELDANEMAALKKDVAGSTDAQAKLESLGQVGDVMRAYYDDAIEAKGPLLDSMWWRLEDKLDEPAQAEDTATGFWAWLFERRAHLATGLIGGLAGALIVMSTQTPPVNTVTVKYVDRIINNGNQVVSASVEGDIVEELEVVGGTGTVMQIPGENESDSDTTVIWVTVSDAEGPI